ncbi:MAG: hypothetical protein HZB41_14830, partial [Ignavibacteriae bacterium]|nr:hypothetical protein [Ignavibacteriota bacterium]
LINRDNDSSALITNDYGDNFYKTDNKDLNITLKEEEGQFTFKRKGIDLDNVFLFFANSLKDSLNSESYQILRYDKSFKMLDSNRLNAGKFIQISKIANDNIITLNLKSYGENKADSTGKTVDYSYYYYLLKSTDMGKTWDSVDVEVLIPQKFSKRFNSDDYFYYNTVAQSQLIFNNYILYPTTEKIIYKYDFVNNKFDSLYYPAIINQFSPISPIFKYWNKLFVISYYADSNKIYFTNDLENINPKWDTLEPGNIFQQWDNFIPPFSDNKDAILSVNMFTDSTGFLVIGKSWNFKGDWYYKLNFAKVILNPLVKVDDNNIETEKVYLWNSDPYPIPGTNIIQSRIYWENNYKIGDAIINVYDINGTILKKENIFIQQLTTYNGILKWDCSDVINGIYIIEIKLAGNSISFPVIINR